MHLVLILLLIFNAIRSTTSSSLNNYDIMRSSLFQKLESMVSTSNEDDPSLLDYSLRKERTVENHNTTLCWAEVFIITEDNKTKKKTLSKEYSIIRETPSNGTEETFKDIETNTYTIVDVRTRKSRTLNFTTVEHTTNFTVMEHKTLYCGTGPVLTQNYEEWPKLGKTKTEVRVSPTTVLEWTLSDELDNQYDTTESAASTNFDTIDTLFHSYSEPQNDIDSVRSLKSNETKANTTIEPNQHGNVLNQNKNETKQNSKDINKPNRSPDAIVSLPKKKDCTIKGKKILLPFKNRIHLLNKHINQTVSTRPNLLDHFIKDSDIFESFESNHDPILFKMVFPLDTLTSMKKIGPKQPFRVKILMTVEYEEGCENSNRKDMSTLRLEEETLIMV